jgi:hypothetical protein
MNHPEDYLQSTTREFKASPPFGNITIAPNCNHDKVYADFVLTSNPPRTPWVCSKCLEQGMETGFYIKRPTYQELIERENGGRVND